MGILQVTVHTSLIGTVWVSEGLHASIITPGGYYRYWWSLDGSPLWGLGVTVPFLLQEIFDQEKGFMVDDCIKLEAHVIADAPHGIK